MYKASRFVLRYARWHISEKRPRRGLWRELYLQRRRGPSTGRSSAPRKEEKTRLNLPPRLVGANEGGTDRPVYALPLSRSCRASTPKCTLHYSRHGAPSLSLSLSLSRAFCPLVFFSPPFLPGVTKFCRPRGTLCLSDGGKKRTERIQVRNDSFFSFHF